MDDLDYEKHLDDYKNLCDYSEDRISHRDSLDFIEKKAQKTHSWFVFNSIRDLFLRSVDVASRLKNAKARYYMRYGAGRRLSMIFYAYQTITHIAYPCI
jgi:hypothetical protein